MQTSQVQCDSGQLATVLAEAIPADKGREFPFKVLRYLADRTRNSPPGTEPLRVATKEIHLDVEGNPNQEASAWMSPLWKTIQNTTLPSIEHTLIAKASHKGLTHYPWVEKLQGNPTYYYLSARLLPAGYKIPACSVSTKSELAPDGVRYTADLSLRPSVFGKMFYGKGFVFSWRKRLGLVTFNLIAYVTLMGCAAIGLYAMHLERDPISVGAIIDLGVILTLIPLALSQMRFGLRIIEDRIVMASELVLKIRENGATMELERAPDTDHLIVRLRRYTATCPICKAMIKLDEGKPDFTRRIVGRCSESPREHVYSFDRVTLAGRPLITPF